ncbi:unnamed protein product [Adineta steineri]|uniref:Uncharacterized protein n=1 Tax=Adineta steineri TaxID=433720 RepID=A0A818JZP5_9BILA|nr:unnamed protein product [Adineta steineri]
MEGKVVLFTLTSLDLSYSQIEDVGAEHLANVLQYNTTLTTLCLWNNKIGDIGAEHLADALKHNTTLTTLDFKENEIGNDGAEYLADALRHNTTLNVLDLEYNQIGDVGVQHLADALQQNTVLASLNLTYNRLGHVGAEHLAVALRHNRTLTTLYLKNNEIEDAGTEHLADALQHNRTLTTLDLEENEIGDAGAQHLADALRHNKRLTTLNLSINQIGDVGAQHLADALQYNPTLSSLNLAYNEIGRTGGEHFTNALLYNTKNFRTNSCGWLFLISSIANLISLFFALITRIMNGSTTDPTETIAWLCKFRAHIVFSSRTIALWLITFATIDRWFLSNINVHRRHLSTLKNAQRSAIFITIFSIILYAQMFYCYEANLMNTPLKCYGKTKVCRHLTDLSLTFITVLCPLFVMILSGLLTISNIRQSHRRIQILKTENIDHSVNKSSGLSNDNPQQKLKRKTDRSFFECYWYNENISPIEDTIDMFVYNMAILLYCISNGMPFYIYTLCGGTIFRKALSDFIQTMKRKIIC